jgi:hypothetical protein
MRVEIEKEDESFVKEKPTNKGHDANAPCLNIASSLTLLFSWFKA